MIKDPCNIETGSHITLISTLTGKQTAGIFMSAETTEEKSEYLIHYVRVKKEESATNHTYFLLQVLQEVDNGMYHLYGRFVGFSLRGAYPK